MASMFAGLDVHSTFCAFAIQNAAGELLKEGTFDTTPAGIAARVFTRHTSVTYRCPLKNRRTLLSAATTPLKSPARRPPSTSTRSRRSTSAYSSAVSLDISPP